MEEGKPWRGFPRHIRDTSPLGALALDCGPRVRALRRLRVGREVCESCAAVQQQCGQQCGWWRWLVPSLVCTTFVHHSRPSGCTRRRERQYPLARVLRVAIARGSGASLGCSSKCLCWGHARAVQPHTAAAQPRAESVWAERRSQQNFDTTPGCLRSVAACSRDDEPARRSGCTGSDSRASAARPPAEG
eukprot:1297989-Prymnesium_polylepis.1